MSRLRNLLLLVALVACAISLWWSRRESRPDSARPVPAAAPPVAVAEPPATVHLAVLNGTGEPGLARRFGRRLADYGCVVVELADAPNDTFGRSLLVNRRLTDAQAEGLARRLGGLPVLREWDARRREDAVLVLGHDHAGRWPAEDRR